MMQKTIEKLSNENVNRQAYEKEILDQARADRKELEGYKAFAKYTDDNIERSRKSVQQGEGR